ncbi:hypothetical protein ACMFMG_007306 [Clarireedia jacksonii]
MVMSPSPSPSYEMSSIGLWLYVSQNFNVWYFGTHHTESARLGLPGMRALSAHGLFAATHVVYNTRQSLLATFGSA